MQHSTPVILGPHFEQFISDEVSSGRYSSASDVVTTALRLLEAEEQKIKWVNDALQKGERSGFVTDFDPQAHLQSLNDKLK